MAEAFVNSNIFANMNGLQQAYVQLILILHQLWMSLKMQQCFSVIKYSLRL